MYRFSQSSSKSGSTSSLLPSHYSPRRDSAPQAAFLNPPSRSPSVKSGLGLTSAESRSLSEKYSLSPSPQTWGTPLHMNTEEPDDFLHNPDPQRDRKSDFGGNVLTRRGIENVGCLTTLVLGLMMLFAGYPLYSHFTRQEFNRQGGFNLGGINASGQIPDFVGNYGLIDKDTPIEAYTKNSYLRGEEYVLVFSDEFEREGRTFYPGDDPYWEGVDLHYWGTNDLEWYDPGQATTRDGALQISLDRVDDITTNHNMSYKSAMLQTWNKFCFTGGILEASVRLPGSSTISGFWPAVWTMGNLGRAGFGATVEGLWPFSYDSCDVGTLPNQTYPGTQLPRAALVGGDSANGGVLSYLPGQRLSACTCPGESHPGPVRPDGSYVGRAAPEIDVIEAIVDNGVGHVSLSSQWAPFNNGYDILNATDGVIDGVVYDNPAVTLPNSYKGGVFQQTTSGLALTNQRAYQRTGGLFTTYAFEYKPGFDDGYITWVNDNQRAWTLFSSAMGPDTDVEIQGRPIPLEPMYIIMNVGISRNFGEVDEANLLFPGVMSVDYVRVYQPKDQVNVGCDPPNFPTSRYIETYKEAYTNPNFTTWEQFEQPWPKNKLMPGEAGCGLV